MPGEGSTVKKTSEAKHFGMQVRSKSHCILQQDSCNQDQTFTSQKKREKKRPLEASSHHYQLVKYFLGATVKGPYHWGSIPVTGKANGRFGDMGLLTATYHLDGGVQVRKSQLLKRSGACTWWRFSWVGRYGADRLEASTCVFLPFSIPCQG